MNLTHRFGIFTISLLLTPALWAKAQLNSMCYLEDKAKAEVQGTNSQHRYEIASLSKIITSYWALQALGPQYRFKTQLVVTAVGSDHYDVHVMGARDPFFGREMTYYLLSELYRLNIRNIRELSFDENFIFNWSVREHPGTSNVPVPENIESSLKERLRFGAKDYNFARSSAESLGVSMEAAPRVSISQVKFLPSNQFTAPVGGQLLELRSVPLFRYLKEMNRVSNNYVADRLYELLGGNAAFPAFIKKQMGYELSDIRFVNGSGDSFKVESSDGKSTKVYNEASCEVLVRILDTTRSLLKRSALDLDNIMAVSGVDAHTTLTGHYSAAGISGAMVAKTGTVDPAITLAGMISTEHGNVYFGILYHTGGPGDWSGGRELVRNQVVNLMAKFGGKDTITNYQTSVFLPFDTASILTPLGPEDSAVAQAAPKAQQETAPLATSTTIALSTATSSTVAASLSAPPVIVAGPSQLADNYRSIAPATSRVRGHANKASRQARVAKSKQSQAAAFGTERPLLPAMTGLL